MSDVSKVLQKSWSCLLRRRSWITIGILFLVAISYLSCSPVYISPHLDYASQPGLQQNLTPSPNSSVIIIVRPEEIPFSASVFDGDRFLTILTAKTHFVYITEPGVHHIMAHVTRHGPSYIDAELAPGKIYFVAIKWLESGIRGWIELIPITPNDNYWGRIPHWLSQSREVKPNASAIDWLAAHRADIIREQGARTSKLRSHQVLARDGVDRAP